VDPLTTADTKQKTARLKGKNMNKRILLTILAGAILSASAVCPAAAPDAAAVTAAVKELQKADWGSMPGSLKVIEAAVVAAPGDEATQKLLQKQLTALLASDAKPGAKSYALRKLSMIAKCNAVPAIAPLLTDKEHSHMARFALQRIGCPMSRKALRMAVGKVTGRQKAGMINSLGQLRDAESTSVLVGLLTDADPQVISAAATALGRIGTPEAATAIGALHKRAPKALAVAVANAYLDAAENLLVSGKAAEAAAIYKQLENDKIKIVRLAAARGMVAANPAQAMPRLLKALDGKDAAMRGVAAEMITQAPGSEATKAFAAGLPKLGPAGQIALLRALAARRDAAARPEVAKLVGSSNEGVRVAAVETLGVVGCAADVKPLAAIAAKKDDKAASAARVSLTKLPGKDVDAAVAGAINDSTPTVQAALITALASRQAKQAVPCAMKCSGSPDAGVRIAAYGALAQLAGPECTAAVARKVVAIKDNRERDAASKALCGICTRGREKSAGAVIAAMGSADAAARKALLRALLHAGGDKALACVKGTATGGDEDLAKEAVRTLTQWRDYTAAPVLMDLTKSLSNKTIKILALRGAITMSGALRDKNRAIGLLKDAQKLISRADETKLLLGTLGNMRYEKALAMVVPYIEVEAVTGEASSAAVKLAQNLDQRKKEVKDAMTKVVSFCKDKRLVNTAKNILKKPKRR